MQNHLLVLCVSVFLNNLQRVVNFGVHLPVTVRWHGFSCQIRYYTFLKSFDANYKKRELKI